MPRVYDYQQSKHYIGDTGAASVGSSGVGTLATVTVPDSHTVQLMASHADLAAADTSQLDRGYRVIARESTDRPLARAATGGTQAPPSINDVLYQNTTGGDVAIDLEAFHSGAGTEDMVGHQTWREVNVP